MKIISTLKRHKLGRVGGLLVVDIIFFGLTNARTVNSFLLIIGYAALILTLYVIAAMTLKRRRGAGWLTGLAAGMLALQSMGGLSPRDWVVVMPLAGLGYLYSTYLAKAV